MTRLAWRHPETGQRLTGRSVGTIPETDLPAAHPAVEGVLGSGARDGRAWLVVSKICVASMASDAADAIEAAEIEFRYP